MLRHAFALGLSPDQVFSMTFRELELCAEGFALRRRWDHETLAWVQANLINIHVPRGKARVRAEDLAPRRAEEIDDGSVEGSVEEMTRAVDGRVISPKERHERNVRRIVERRDREDRDAFWGSLEGKRAEDVLAGD